MWWYGVPGERLSSLVMEWAGLDSISRATWSRSSLTAVGRPSTWTAARPVRASWTMDSARAAGVLLPMQAPK
ncbi:hypothetical protein BJF79_45145 [Actinomadura sp. CNU-125]|nr:hypothetical protein BJF79_45145 [Actinomadura sp. CNU-125]